MSPVDVILLPWDVVVLDSLLPLVTEITSYCQESDLVSTLFCPSVMLTFPFAEISTPLSPPITSLPLMFTSPPFEVIFTPPTPPTVLFLDVEVEISVLLFPIVNLPFINPDVDEFEVVWL